MNLSEKSKEEISKKDIELQEEDVPVPKRNLKRKIVFFGLSIFVLVLLTTAGYFIYKWQQKSPVPKVAQKNTSGYNASKVPGESSIANFPESIHLTTDLSIPARHIIVPDLQLSFNSPIQLRTGQELHSSIHDENNAQSVIRLYRDNTKYTKDRNGYDVADNTIIFSFDFRYGIDPIEGTGQEILNQPKDLNDTISFTNSILASGSAAFSKFYDTQHIRYNNETTDTYKAVVRMDVVTEEGRHFTIGAVYICYDQVDKNLCKQTFQMFVSSLKFEKATLEAPPPTYAEKDVFGLFPFAKKNLNTEKELLWYDTNLFDQSVYKEENVPVIAQLKDDDLENIRCLPQQLFLPDVANRPPLEVIGVYLPPLVSDPNINSILTQLKSRVPDGYLLSQFTACQTENNRYLIKYNINLLNKTRTKTDILHAKIATMDDKGNFEDIVDIPNTNSYCSHFLALTKDNILYFACVPFYDNNSTGIDMYKVDIAQKSYDKIYTCTFPANAESDMTKYCK